MPQPLTTISLKGRALRALAAREYSRLELLRKLGPYVQEGDDLEAVLGDLQAKGFLSDVRATESVINRRAPKLGAARVLQELQQKGVDSAALAGAAAQLKASELERAREVWQKKFGKHMTGAGAGAGAGASASASTDADMDAPASAAQRARQMRFLASRGFAPEVIRQVLRAV